MMAKITAKGQLTVPKEIRETLGVKPGDFFLFYIEEGKAVMYPVKGSLLDLRGSIKPKNVPEDLEKVREQVKKKVARRIPGAGLR
jgi:AbrB family looped-hinge helix DNA binding protein